MKGGKVILLAVLAGALGFGGYVFYQMNMAPHPAIVACEEAVKNSLKSPSSYNLDMAIMQVENMEGAYPAVILSFDAQNPMGATLRMEATCQYYFTDTELNRKFIESHISKNQPEFFLPIGKSPFDEFDIVSAIIGTSKVDDSIVDGANFKIMFPHRLGKNKFVRKGAGEIIEVISFENVKYKPETATYHPKKIIRYKRFHSR